MLNTIKKFFLKTRSMQKYLFMDINWANALEMAYNSPEAWVKYLH